MTNTIRNILQDLERVRENMLALSDDIWLSIDHNDPDALQEGVDFKKAYNERMIGFDRLSSEISELVQQYTAVRIDEPEEEAQTAQESDQQKNERIIRDLDREEAHAIGEDFTFKRPYGFVLCGQGFKEVNTWRRIFEQVCRILNARDTDRFNGLPDNPDFKTRRGNVYFSTDPDKLRVASEVVPGLFAEVNLSANHLRNLIRDLLKTFQIPETDITIYLRQDRDADSESE
ncbi:MAG: hypothetical protein H8E62_03750 [Planctomycetes bacterium]|nr:hypothetical protein [Planctomycetota bacterium]